MPIEPDLLRILVCPRTHRPLRPATAEELEAVNARIAAGTAVNRAGQAVTAAVPEGLVPEGEPVLYPILEGIPVLLVDEAIRMTDAAGAAAESGT